MVYFLSARLSQFRCRAALLVVSASQRAFDVLTHDPTFLYTFGATYKQCFIVTSYSLCQNVGVASLSEVLTFSRWGAMRLPSRFPRQVNTKFTAKENVYPYEISKDGDVDFYVNFADQNLFGFYGGGLFAQDELQVAGA